MPQVTVLPSKLPVRGKFPSEYHAPSFSHFAEIKLSPLGKVKLANTAGAAVGDVFWKLSTISYVLFWSALAPPGTTFTDVALPATLN